MKQLRNTFAVGAVLCVGLTALALAQTAGQQQGEDRARREYDVGLQFMQSQKYAEALKDFQSVIDSYPTSSVAGDALLEVAKYYLDVAHDAAAAQERTDLILKKYASSEAAAVAFVLNGRIATEKAKTPAEVEAALATFERVPGLFPGSLAVPSSIYYAGEALRTIRRYDDALERYREVTLKYPGSEWARRAAISLAECLVQTGRASAAIEGLQRVRLDFPGTPEAATALKWNTILYRLYIRPPAQPPYAFGGQVLGGPATKFKDLTAIALDDHDNVFAAHKTAVAVLDGKGALVRSIPADEPSALALSPAGVPAFVRGNALTSEGGKAVLLAAPQSGGQTKPVEEIPAVVNTPQGDWLVADKKGKAIEVFSSAGKFVKPFASGIIATRLAQSPLGDVAALDRDNAAIVLFDPAGKVIVKAGVRGTGYDMQDAVDLAFDALGHLYVLDRARGVFVFSPQGKFMTSFAIPEKSPGSFSRAVAFGVDSAARLYIFDDRAQNIQIYQ